MTRRRTIAATLVLLALFPVEGSSQGWRRTAANIGPAPRVLIIGARPEDEDNALLAWLGLGRGVETAFLSITRGEASPNVAGSEKQSALAVLRTAELIAERQRDGAHQYFTRAYDFGPASEDSVVDRLWPRDTLLRDVVSVIRAFRPHVVISMSDTVSRDATRRRTAQLVRAAFQAAGDTAALASRATSRLPAWSPARLYTRVDSSAANGPDIVTVDVGELDREEGNTYAEIGAEIRRLQRTQPALPSPKVGKVPRWLRLEAARGGSANGDLFAGVDTTWGRLRTGAVAVDAQVDSLRAAVAAARALGYSARPDMIAEAFAHVVGRSIATRLAIQCSESAGVPLCGGALGDLMATLRTIRERATRVTLDAAGVVVDGTVSREFVAVRDSVTAEVTVFNGGSEPVMLRRLAANGRAALATLVGDSVRLAADSAFRWNGVIRVDAQASHWWQLNGLMNRLAIHAVGPGMSGTFPELIAGEDRVPIYGPEATIAIAGVDVSVPTTQWVYRGAGMIRGDDRHFLIGLRPKSVLLERTAEYERASIPVNRLFRVYVSSARASTDTVVVELKTPASIKVDTVERRVVLPPFSGRNVFFRIRGTLKPGSDSISALVRIPTPAPGPRRAGSVSDFGGQTFQVGTIPREYPHVPTQVFFRLAGERLEAVDLRVPPRLRVAYVKGTDEIPTYLGQLQINVQTLDPSLLSVVDLTVFNTVLIGADAARGDALAGAIEPLQAFVRQGGTVVVLPQGPDVAQSGLFPFPVAFDTLPRNITNPDAEAHFVNPRSSLLSWPNAITAKDFTDWAGERARNVPIGIDTRYGTVVAIGDPETATPATILTARMGRGMFVYTALALDTQLASVHAGAARLLVNMLTAGMSPAKK
jgi:LmbE family N-acetylglucosaminyl deacetylase